MKLSWHKGWTHKNNITSDCNKATCIFKIQYMHTLIIASLTTISRICPMHAVNQILLATTLFHDPSKINWFAVSISVIPICVVFKTSQQGLVCTKFLILS